MEVEDDGVGIAKDRLEELKRELREIPVGEINLGLTSSRLPE